MVFEAMLSVFLAGDEVNLVSVERALASKGLLKTIGGDSALSELQRLALREPIDLPMRAEWIRQQTAFQRLLDALAAAVAAPDGLSEKSAEDVLQAASDEWYQANLGPGDIHSSSGIDSKKRSMYIHLHMAVRSMRTAMRHHMSERGESEKGEFLSRFMSIGGTLLPHFDRERARHLTEKYGIPFDSLPSNWYGGMPYTTIPELKKSSDIHYSRNRIIELANSGQLPGALLVGGQWLLRPESIEALINRQALRMEQPPSRGSRPGRVTRRSRD
jgi:hypothetical protein